MNADNPTPASLKAVIAEAYEVFGCYKAPAGPLDVCLGCCMSTELELEMRRLPLAQLAQEHFYEYNSSAKGQHQPVAEVLYLLPRLLELIAKGEEVHHSTELFLDRVGRCAEGSFTDAEQHVLSRFALAYFEHALNSAALWNHEPLSLLLMFHKGGQSIEPLLESWLNNECPEATVKYVHETYWNFWTGRTCSIAFAADDADFRQQIHDWIVHPANRERFTRKLMNDDFSQLASQQKHSGCMSFDTLVDAVFDELTQ
ncbi:MAG: hypothetical protein RLZZ618_3042 [Pseudomonadota bacterium]|jgi:hypothetical protein